MDYCPREARCIKEPIYNQHMRHLGSKAHEDSKQNWKLGKPRETRITVVGITLDLEIIWNLSSRMMLKVSMGGTPINGIV